MWSSIRQDAYGHSYCLAVLLQGLQIERVIFRRLKQQLPPDAPHDHVHIPGSTQFPSLARHIITPVLLRRV